MISRTVAAGLRERPPYLTLALMAAVLATSIPQFFLGEVYDALTGTLFGLEVPHYLALPLFSHSPDILAAHLLGNLAVLALFGGLSEIVLGSRRFAVLTVTAAAVSLGFSYLRGLSEVHGVSGIGWAFHVPALLALIVAAERQPRARSLLRDALFWVYAAFYLFDFLALPLLEVVVLGRRFFENFGQVQHLAAVVTAVPFVLVWRQSIERRVAGLCGAGRPATGAPGAAVSSAGEARGPTSPTAMPRRRRRLPQAILIVLLAVNLAGTASAVSVSIGAGSGWAGEPVAGRYTLAPARDTPPAEVGSVITVTFAEDMVTGEVNVRRRSIWYEREPAPQLDCRWRSSRELSVVLSRPLEAEEALVLELDVYLAGPRGVPVPVPVNISYGRKE
jgi:membrane associated rhomboid family serine protease